MAGCRLKRMGVPAVEKYCGSCTSMDMELFSSDTDSAGLRHGRKEFERIGT